MRVNDDIFRFPQEVVLASREIVDIDPIHWFVINHEKIVRPGHVGDPPHRPGRHVGSRSVSAVDSQETVGFIDDQTSHTSAPTHPSGKIEVSLTREEIASWLTRPQRTQGSGREFRTVLSGFQGSQSGTKREFANPNGQEGRDEVTSEPAAHAPLG
jgi:hypothetical protein